MVTYAKFTFRNVWNIYNMNTHSIGTTSAGPSESSVSRDEHSSTSHLWYTGLYLSYTFLNNSFYSEPFIYIIYNNIQYIIYNNITIYLWYIGLYPSYITKSITKWSESANTPTSLSLSYRGLIFFISTQKTFYLTIPGLGAPLLLATKALSGFKDCLNVGRLENLRCYITLNIQ